MKYPSQCNNCGGQGYLATADICHACDGTGWEDRQERLYCAECDDLCVVDAMHVSPDEDGNRIVCRECCDKLEQIT